MICEDEILSTELTVFLEAELSVFKNKKVGIFGAGFLGHEISQLLDRIGISDVTIFDDYLSEPVSHQNGRLHRLNQIRTIKPDVIIIASAKARIRMIARLEQLAYTGVIISLPGQDDDIYGDSNNKSVAEIQQFYNKHVNERAFIIGNGPSLLKTDPRRIKNGITFACNNIYYLNNFTPDYYAVEDVLVAEDRADIINDLPYTKFFPSDLKKWLTNGYFFNAVRVPEVDWFSTDCAVSVPVNATVTYTLMQLAFFMGCNPVYLIGVDHSYKVLKDQFTQQGNVFHSVDDDPNHFDTQYFGKGYRWHNPRVDRMENAYEFARKAYRKHGRKIYNATDKGKLDIFQRVDFEQLI